MSMTLHVRRVTEAELQMLKNNPASIFTFIFDPSAHVSGDLVNFGHAWHAIHFMLSGAQDYSDSPLGVLLSGDEAVGEGIGYGPPVSITHARLVAFNDALSNLSDEDIRLRYDPNTLVDNRIYKFSTYPQSPDEDLSYILQGVQVLRKIVARCSSTGASALVAII